MHQGGRHPKAGQPLRGAWRAREPGGVSLSGMGLTGEERAWSGVGAREPDKGQAVGTNWSREVEPHGVVGKLFREKGVVAALSSSGTVLLWSERAG